MKKHHVIARLRGLDRWGVWRYDIETLRPDGSKGWKPYCTIIPPDAMVKRVRHNIAERLFFDRMNARARKE